MASDAPADTSTEARSCGLGPALAALARRTTGATVVVRSDVDGSLPRLVEMALVAVAVEGIANATAHAQAPVVEIDLRGEPGGVSLRVTDDGLGGARVAPGGGLDRLRTQVAGLGGSLTVDSPAWAGTVVHAELPL